MQHVTEEVREAECRKHRREAEQQRQAGRHQGAERQHEDRERDRQRGELRTAEVMRERLVHGLDAAGVAQLADEQPRVGVLYRGRGCERWSDAIRGGVGVT